MPGFDGLPVQGCLAPAALMAGVAMGHAAAAAIASTLPRESLVTISERENRRLPLETRPTATARARGCIGGGGSDPDLVPSRKQPKPSSAGLPGDRRLQVCPHLAGCLHLFAVRWLRSILACMACHFTGPRLSCTAIFAALPRSERAAGPAGFSATDFTRLQHRPVHAARCANCPQRRRAAAVACCGCDVD